MTYPLEVTTDELFYQLFCTIVELPIEPPVIEHDECSFRSSEVQCVPELASFWLNVLFFVKYMFILPWGKCKKCLIIKIFIKGSASRTWASSRLAQSVFSLGYFWLLNKRPIISEFFTHSSKVGVVVLMFRPWEVIRAFVSIFFVMLGIPIELYEHVLGPPRVSFDSEKK